MSKIIFATGCDSHYFQPWLELYTSIKLYIPNSIVYFFDLGLTQEQVDYIQNIDINYNYFDFSQYPEWVNINNDAGQWAWKPQIIKSVMDRYEIVTNENQYLIWCDARNQLDCSLDVIIYFIEKNGIYTNTTDGNVARWTVKETIEYLDGMKYIDMPMRNAALPCFNINIDWVRNLINEYAELSLIKDCIFPLGSSRMNHRQDQSVLTLLYYKYKDNYLFDDSDFNAGIRVHTGNFITRPYHY